MKKQFLLPATIALASFLFLGSCTKENSHSENALADAVESSEAKQGPPLCGICPSATGTYNLDSDLAKTKLKEGNNAVTQYAEGYKVIAQVKNGVITGIVLEVTNGKFQQPTSVEKRRIPGDERTRTRTCFLINMRPFCVEH